MKRSQALPRKQSDTMTRPSSLEERIKDATACIRRRRRREDPPDATKSQVAQKGMSSADFNYLSLPSLFGGRPVSSRIESSMNDCMLESGAYVSYIAEAMDPTPRLDPEGTLGEPSKALPDEEIDFVDENTITDKSDAAFIQAYLRRIEAGETIRKRAPEQMESMSLNDEGTYVKQPVGSINEEAKTAQQRGGPLACTPMAVKTPKSSNVLISTNRLCFGDDPGSPLSTTSGDGGPSVREYDSDSIDAPQQQHCKIKDDNFPVSPAMRSGIRRIQSPRRQRSRSKSKASRSRQSPRRKSVISTPSVNFTSTLDSGSLCSAANPLNQEETGEHIEVIFVEEQFRHNNNDDAFQFGQQDGALFSSLLEHHQPDNPLVQNEWEITPSHLKSLRKRSLMDTRGTTTEEESTIRLDERDTLDPRRISSPQQSRQPASPLIELAEEHQSNDSSIDSAFVSKDGSKWLLEYSQSEATDQQVFQASDQAFHTSEREGQHATHNMSVPNQKESLEVSQSMPSDERRLLMGDSHGQESSTLFEPNHNQSFAMASAANDEALKALFGKSLLDVSLTTKESMPNVPGSVDAVMTSGTKSNAKRRLTVDTTLAEDYTSWGDKQKAFESLTPLVAHLKSELLELDISRSNEVPESDFAKEQISRDMFSITSDSKSKSSRGDTKTTARVKSLMAFVDCSSPMNMEDRAAKRLPEPVKTRFPKFYGSDKSTTAPRFADRGQKRPSVAPKKFPSFFVPFDPNEKEIERRKPATAASSFFVPFDSNDEDATKKDHNREPRKPQSVSPKCERSSSNSLKCALGGTVAHSSKYLATGDESRGPDIATLVQKHGMLQTIHKKTTNIALHSGAKSILADSPDSEHPGMNTIENQRVPSVTGSQGLTPGVVSEPQIEPTESRFAVCESVPSSILSQRTMQESSEKSADANCNSLPSPIRTDSTPEEPLGIVANISLTNPSASRDSAKTAIQEHGAALQSAGKDATSRGQSTRGSRVEEYFTCQDKDESSPLLSQEGDPTTENTSSRNQIDKAASFLDRPSRKLNRGRAISPLTIEKMSTARESDYGAERSRSGPPQIIEIIQEDESSSEDKSNPMSTLAIRPSVSSQSQLDSIQSTLDDRPCGSGWDASTIAPRSYISSRETTAGKQCNGAGTSLSLFTRESSIPREISTADIISVSVGTVQSCVTSSSRKSKDRLGSYSRGRTFSRTTYIRQTHSSVSVSSRRDEKTPDTKSPDRGNADSQRLTNSKISTPLDEGNNDRLAYLRNALNSERTRIIERVSALIPAQPGKGTDSDVERTVQSVFNESGVVLYQPTINLYGAGQVPLRLEPEGVTRYSSSSSRPEIINLTEAEEERQKAAKANNFVEDSGTFDQKYTPSLDQEPPFNLSEAISKNASEDHLKGKIEPEAMSAKEYQRINVQKRAPDASVADGSASSNSRPKVDVVTVTSPVTSSDEARDLKQDEQDPERVPQPQPIQPTGSLVSRGTIRLANPYISSSLLQSLAGVSGQRTRHNFAAGNVIDCTSEMYDLPEMFDEKEWASQSLMREEWSCLSPEVPNMQHFETTRRALPQKCSHQSPGEDRGQPSENVHRAHKRGHDFGQDARQDNHRDHGKNQYKVTHESVDSGFLADNPIDSMDSRRGRSRNWNRRQLECPSLRECPNPIDRYHIPCPPCPSDEMVSKMGDFCVKAGYGISDVLRRAMPGRNEPYGYSRKSVIHDDDDDGMEAELRDLEMSEQLLRRELELVHQQAELRRQRLRISEGGVFAPSGDFFSDCLWPTSTVPLNSDRLIGRRLVANSFSASHKSVDDDLTDQFFSPTEDYSTTTYISRQTSMEPSQSMAQTQQVIPQVDENEEVGLEPDGNDEHEIIFVEESFVSTDSFSFGDVTKKSAHPRKSTKESVEPPVKTSDLSYLKRTQSHSSGPDPVGEVRTGSQAKQPIGRLGDHVVGSNLTGTRSEPVEIISLLSLDQPSPKAEAAQPGDPGMPILVACSQDSTSLEGADLSRSRDKCDPPGSSLDSESTNVLVTEPQVTSEKGERAAYLQAMGDDKKSALDDPYTMEPLESIEVIALESGRVPAVERAESTVSPDRVGSMGTAELQSIDKMMENRSAFSGSNRCDPFAAPPHVIEPISSNSEHLYSHDRHHRVRPSVTFAVPESNQRRSMDTGSSAPSVNRRTNVNSDKLLGGNADIIDLRDFDESFLDNHSLSSSSRNSGSLSHTSSSRGSLQERCDRSNGPQHALVTASTEAKAKFERPARSKQSAASTYSASVSSRSTSEKSGQSLKRLETIDRVGNKEGVAFFGSRPELPLAATSHDSSYGTSTFEERTTATRDTYSCESLSSRVKKLIEKAKSNRRDAGHDTFESRSTLTIMIPEYLSYSDEDHPVPPPELKSKPEQEIQEDIEQAIEDSILIDFSSQLAANRVPARVMLSIPASHDQGSLSTITVPQLQEERGRKTNQARKEKVRKEKSYPNIMAFVQPLARKASRDKDGMEIHISREDDESSVTMDFPESLSRAFVAQTESSAKRGNAQKSTYASSLQRLINTSPPRIQRLINTGKRFVSSKKSSPKVEHRQTAAELEIALDDIWSLEAENTHQSRDTKTDSLNYSISPNDSVEKASAKRSVASQASSKSKITAATEIEVHRRVAARRERVKKLHRTHFFKGRSDSSAAIDPSEDTNASKSHQETDEPAIQETHAATSPSALLFEQQFAAMRQRVQEMRQPSHDAYRDIFRESPQTVGGSSGQLPKQQLRPPLPPRSEREP